MLFFELRGENSKIFSPTIGNCTPINHFPFFDIESKRNRLLLSDDDILTTPLPVKHTGEWKRPVRFDDEQPKRNSIVKISPQLRRLVIDLQFFSPSHLEFLFFGCPLCNFLKPPQNISVPLYHYLVFDTQGQDAS